MRGRKAGERLISSALERVCAPERKKKKKRILNINTVNDTVKRNYTTL